jgi:hypothetical protein
MPRGRPKKPVRDPNRPVVQRWTTRKWAEHLAKGKGVRALVAAGPDFTKRVMKAYAAIQKGTEITQRIARLKSQLARLEGMGDGEPARLEMEDCEKVLISIANTLPDVSVKAKPPEKPSEIGEVIPQV